MSNPNIVQPPAGYTDNWTSGASGGFTDEQLTELKQLIYEQQKKYAVRTFTGVITNTQVFASATWVDLISVPFSLTVPSRVNFIGKVGRALVAGLVDADSVRILIEVKNAGGAVVWTSKEGNIQHATNQDYKDIHTFDTNMGLAVGSYTAVLRGYGQQVWVRKSNGDGHGQTRITATVEPIFF